MQSKWDAAGAEIRQKVVDPTLWNRIEYRLCDVRLERSVSNVIGRVFDDYGHIDVYFNNAGVQPGKLSGDIPGDITQVRLDSTTAIDGSICYSIPAPQPMSPCLLRPDANASACPARDGSQFSKISPYAENEIATSIMGMFYCLKWETVYAFEHQPPERSVAIINTSSRVGIIPDPSRILYAAAKASIISMTRSVANQVAQRYVREHRAPVRVCAIAPGPVCTPMEMAAFSGGGDWQSGIKKAIQGVPMQRMASPDEVAPAVLFLSDEKMASYITGIVLPVDGGDTGSNIVPCL
jgi:NAD(P)-dependent dehydrogenase (short-subunit alcohol dehydrogenase family)